MIAESERRKNNELSVIPSKLSTDLGTFLCEFFLLCEWNEAAERSGRRVASWFACGAARQINQAPASILIRGLRFTAVLANGTLCLETLLIASVPFLSSRVSCCKAMSGEGQECFVNGAWDLEQDFNSPSSGCNTTQYRLCRLVMSGDIWAGVQSQGY